MAYPWATLGTVRRWEPEMRRLGVSEVARSRRGFLTAYKRAGGDPRKLSEAWRRKRDAFIARHLVQYMVARGYRGWLALIAWAYIPPQPPLRQGR